MEKKNEIEFTVPVNEDGTIDKTKLQNEIFDAIKSNLDDDFKRVIGITPEGKEITKKQIMEFSDIKHEPNIIDQDKTNFIPLKVDDLKELAKDTAKSTTLIKNNSPDRSGFESLNKSIDNVFDNDFKKAEVENTNSSEPITPENLFLNIVENNVEKKKEKLLNSPNELLEKAYSYWGQTDDSEPLVGAMIKKSIKDSFDEQKRKEKEEHMQMLFNKFFAKKAEDMFYDALKKSNTSDIDELKLFASKLKDAVSLLNLEAIIDDVKEESRWDELAFGNPKEEFSKVNAVKVGEIIVKKEKSFTNEDLFIDLLDKTYGGTCSFIKIREHYKIWKNDDFDLLINNLVSLGKITFKNGIVNLIRSKKEYVG